MCTRRYKIRTAFAVLAAGLLLPSVGWSAPRNVQYYLAEPFSAGPSVTDYLYACVVISNQARHQTLSFYVLMTDANQLLAGDRLPVEHERNGGLSFKFVDGWNDHGKGTFKVNGDKAVLDLTMTKPSSGPHNIGRNYGTYVLTRGFCKAFFGSRASSD